MPVARRRSILAVALCPMTPGRVRVVVEASVDGPPSHSIEEPAVAVESRLVRVYAKQYAEGEPEPTAWHKTHEQLLAEGWRHAERVERSLVVLAEDGALCVDEDFGPESGEAPPEWREAGDPPAEDDDIPEFGEPYFRAASRLFGRRWPAAEDETRLLPVITELVERAVRWQERYRHNRRFPPLQ